MRRALRDHVAAEVVRRRGGEPLDQVGCGDNGADAQARPAPSHFEKL